MRRITLSTIMGIVFPIGCLMAIGASEEYLPLNLTEVRFYGKPMPGIVWMPFVIPIYILDILREVRILRPTSDSIFWLWVFGISFVLFDWILYGTISYLLLGRLNRFKKPPVPTSEIPPPPPTF